MNQLQDGGFDFNDILKDYNPMKLLHGEHYLKINKFPIPTSGELNTKAYPIAVIQKTSKQNNKTNTLLISGYDTIDTSTNEVLFHNQGSYFIKDCSSKTGKSEQFPQTHPVIPFKFPKVNLTNRNPDVEATYKTSENQASLYRLNADFNPLHIDPQFAEGGGFNKPILHGLCFFGISCKLLVDHYGLFDEVKLRFTNVVYPGETLKVVAWDAGNGVILFQTWVTERNVKVIDLAGIKLVNFARSKL
ncbi:unnamed protein product [Ambrosiozyma monospora]|uniref:Unnamed protein product n=1 Tax=Ambrosiozyma monospora TaxID=43982 RepID=A0ACB5T6P8_AMBMO|nr:unnamed protein product [Ambrosiozyma monospora]